jgi:glycosyltransferase involved in cell wall biosynthesis
VVVVTAIKTPYRDPFWSVLSERTDIVLMVLYCADQKPDRPWDDSTTLSFDHEVLPGWNLSRAKKQGKSQFLNPQVAKFLRNSECDVVIVGGYNHLTMLLAMAWAYKNNTPYYLMCESHLEKSRPVWKQLLKSLFLRPIIRCARGAFPTGKLASKYLQYYGITEQQLVLFPNVPDVVTISEQARSFEMSRKDFRASLNLPVDACVAIFVGRLIRSKGGQIILKSISELKQPNNLHLLIVGDGVERENLELQVRELKLSNRVHFCGFKQSSEIPMYLACADFLVLPSTETWGVVVLEALASGLPVLVSDEVGCHPDVVTSPVLGQVVKKHDIDAWASVLEKWRVNAPCRDAVIRTWSDASDLLTYRAISKRVAEFLHTTSH